MTFHETVGDSFLPNRPQGWMVSIHSEGNRFAYNTVEDVISAITEAHVTDPGVAEQLERASQCLALLLPKKISDDHLPESYAVFSSSDGLN